VVDLADVVRRFADSYLSAYGTTMPSWHRRAIDDIMACRTPELGGQVWCCDACEKEVFSYHSCRNRACPKCHNEQTQEWLEARRAEMLRCNYFHVTVTVPAELRPLLRANQRDGYALLMKTAADAITELARDRRYVGGTVGVLAVLHTWTQQLVYHPHVHCLVTGGGVSADGRDWYPSGKEYLFPERALAKLVRGKLKALLAQKRPDLVAPAAAWKKRWVVHVTPWGENADDVLRYLARYVFRTAITNSRILACDKNSVTIRYKDRKSSCWRTCRMSGHEFLRRFLQHVLPKGLHRVRYFGLWHPSKRAKAAQVRLRLALDQRTQPVAEAVAPSEPKGTCQSTDRAPMPRTCPLCHKGHLVYVGRLTPKNALGP
jgi:hypothetical protein